MNSSVICLILTIDSLPASYWDCYGSSGVSDQCHYSFDFIFSKQIEAIGKNEDVLIAISTSGSSKNVIEALKTAKFKNIYTLSMVGENSNNVKEYSDDVFSIPSKETGVVQQSHISILQVIAGLIELWSIEEN